jgi:hypothetical protein
VASSLKRPDANRLYDRSSAKNTPPLAHKIQIASGHHNYDHSVVIRPQNPMPVRPSYSKPSDANSSFPQQLQNMRASCGAFELLDPLTNFFIAPLAVKKASD